MTLLEAITSDLGYDTQWAIYAERVDGVFAEDSNARFGRTEFDNGGLLDDLEFFENSAVVVDATFYWTEGDISLIVEAAQRLIEEVNERLDTF